MKRSTLLGSLLFCSLCSSMSVVMAGPAASIASLDWMSGSWATALGPNTLEENWIKPAGGSIAAMVRMSAADSTSMYEVIIIEEKDGSLEMTIQQFDAGFVPRTAQAQKLELQSITDNTVMFSAITEGSMKTLGYSRTSPTTFQIDMETAQGQPVKAVLNAR